jgi:hypothetical protein
MRYGIISVLLLASATLVSGCTKAVIGPDLAHRPTPFIADGTVELSDGFGLMQATITARPEGDTATARYSELGDKPYNAAVTYHAFVPIIAESNRAKKDYWLVGLNLASTEDRSFYAVVRYPSGKPLQPGTMRGDFEFRLLNCGPYRPRAKPADGDEPTEAEMETARQDTPANRIPFQENETLCLFDRIEDVEQHANHMLQQDDIVRRETQADPEAEPENLWSRMTVKAR